MKLPFTLAAALVCLSPLAADAQITIFGSPTGYQSTNKDWQSETANDIDGNGLGTDGFIFFGDFVEEGTDVQINPGNENPGLDQMENIIGINAGTQLSDSDGPQFTVLAPSYVTIASTGASSGNVGQFPGYEMIDSPVTLDGTDAQAGNLLVTGDGSSALEFTVSGLPAGTTVRVGVLGAVLNDGPTAAAPDVPRARFDAPEIGLSDGTNSVSVTELPNLSDGLAGPSLGWVFFDIQSDGDYTITVPPDADGENPDVTGLGGVTFDSISSDIPFVLGDASVNGVVDFDDIAPFITLLANGQFLAQADIDGSTVVDFDDIAGFIGILAGP